MIKVAHKDKSVKCLYNGIIKMDILTVDIDFVYWVKQSFIINY